ncbi:restriction endonuclease subunit S [Sorangium sp. So ce861]|uniref:restriction endonuclease subunit S n=1 Tax=Sorangium sp. So ce861 TaxID=3133323 RepID=UPI003F5E1C75
MRPLGEVLERRSEVVNVAADGTYREIGIRSHGKGIFHKEPVAGADLGDKRVFWLQPDCLVFNIVFAWEGAVAVTSVREREMIASHRFPMFRPTQQPLADVQFLRRFFQTELGLRLLGEASPGGAGRNRTLNQRMLAELPLPIPPLGEQRRIAAILSSVDDAIEATQAVIDQLQVVKKAMMTELLMRGLPGRHVRFKKTEFGEVPVDWSTVTLGTLLVRGPDNGLYKPQSDYGSGTPIVRIDAFANGDRVNGDGLRRVRASNEEIRRFCLHGGDILINRVNSLSHLGKVGIVGEPPEPTVFESNMMRLTVDSTRVLPSFAFLILASPMTKAFFLQRAKQAVAQASINQQDVRAVFVPLPTLPEQAAISSGVENVDLRTAAECHCLELLSGLRSMLLSALLSGEIRVTPDEASP